MYYYIVDVGLCVCKTAEIAVPPGDIISELIVLVSHVTSTEQCSIDTVARQ
ncbi:uncharacterized protein PHALS_12861 [Plasmopara halstedii]|uniref:Uncharacterized protein n=1 Tax=Plasmopara halstedii TaxID=4781 RepID=A0A0P1ANA3_PLAHL|nr:uncharacterized protein PHALS_12861 [Plasmopara halstedii]CEG42599.1 hypothetical protein PHALS_12861 [Plasmopara halstedii]|eukprot:XP_024578968.1 hypothetical protein PHALS_12861 [Plasmopara halstedii]